jgi:hypothetical protein
MPAYPAAPAPKTSSQKQFDAQQKIAKAESDTQRATLDIYHRAKSERSILDKQFEEMAAVQDMFVQGTPQWDAHQRKMGELLDRRAYVSKREQDLEEYAQEEMKSLVASTVSIGGNSLYMVRDGVGKVADPSRIQEQVDKVSERLGIQDEEFRKKLYNEMLAEVDMAPMVERSNEIAQQKIKPLLEREQQRFKEGFKSDEEISARATAQIDSIGSAVKQRADKEQEVLLAGANEVYASVTAPWKDAESRYEQAAVQIQQQINVGAIPYDQGKAMYEQATAEYNAAYAKYQEDWKANADSLLNESSRIAARYNQQYQQEQRRIIDAANKDIEKAAEQYAKEFKSNPDVATKIKLAYKSAWDEAIDERGKRIEVTEDMRRKSISAISPQSAAADVFFRSTIHGLGGAFKGISTTIGSDTGYRMGEEMERAYYMPEAKSSKVSDLLDPLNFVALSGQLGGAMAPSLVASAVIAKGTGGLGAPAAVQMVASALAGWGAETADIAGRAKDQVMAQTGNIEKANEAWNKSFVSQVQMLPAYSFDGLPFVSGMLSRVPTVAGRVATGAGIEYVTEMFQELPQNVAERNILEGKEAWDDFAQGIFDPENKEILISMAPIAILGGGGQITSKSAKSVMERSVKDYVASQRVSEFVETAPSQWLSHMTIERGSNFAQAVLASMHQNGTIDEQKLQQLEEMRVKSMEHIENARGAGLNQREANVYGAFAAKADDLRIKAKDDTNPVAQMIAKARLSEVEKTLRDFVTMKEAQYVEVSYADPKRGTTIMDIEEARRLLSDDRFIKQASLLGLTKDGITVNGVGAEGVALADFFANRVSATNDRIAAMRMDPASAQRTMADVRQDIDDAVSESAQPATPTATQADIDAATGVTKVVAPTAEAPTLTTATTPTATQDPSSTQAISPEGQVATPSMTLSEGPSIGIGGGQGFAPRLRELGYTDAEISKMNPVQQQDIVEKGTEPARAESTARVIPNQPAATTQAPVDPNDDAEVTIDEEVDGDLDEMLVEATGTPLTDAEIDSEIAEVTKAIGGTVDDVVELDQDGLAKAVVDNGGNVANSMAEGFFIGKDKDGKRKIYINRDMFRRGLMAHEGTHAIVFDALSKDPKAKKIISNSAKQALGASPGAKKVLLKFLENYGGAKTKADGSVDVDATVADPELGEEVMSEFVAALYNGSIKLDNAMRQFIRDLYNRIMAALGVSTKVEFKEDGDFIAAAKQIASAMKAGRKIETGKRAGAKTPDSLRSPVSKEGEPGPLARYSNRKKAAGSKIKYKPGGYKLSHVKESDLIDIEALVKDIADSGKNVWYWTADQLGIGMYSDETLDGEHVLDAGPSFALDPENRKNGVIWASGASQKALQNNADKADYIFIVSGSPQKSKLFNKRVVDLLRDRAEKASGLKWSAFAEKLMGLKPPSKVAEILGKYDTFDELLNSTGSDRKNLFIALEEQRVSTPNTPTAKYLNQIGVSFNVDALRDGFYRDNDFGINDIMIVLKPTGVGGKSKHSTYEWNLLGEVVGVPDRRVNGIDVLPKHRRDRYTEAQRMSPLTAQPGQFIDKASSELLGGPKFSKGPATQNDFKKGGIKDLLNKSDWVIMTAENPSKQKLSDTKNASRMKSLMADLDAMGAKYTPVDGKYGNEEKSLAITGVNEKQAIELGKKYGQESVLTNKGLVYQDGTYNPATGVSELDTKPDDFYSVVNGQVFQIDIDFDKKLSSPKFSKATPGKNLVPADRRNDLTDDGKGNYVFFHKGPKSLKGGKINPSYFGSGKSKDNRSNPVMNYYTKPDQGERMISGDVTYAVPVPKWKVYPLMSDPLDLYDKAEANFRKKFGKDQAFDAVRQADFIGPLAEKAGFDMMIAGWSVHPLRAESGKALKPDAKLTKKYEDEGVVDLTKSVDPYYEKLMAKARADRDKQNAKEAKGFGGPKFSKKADQAFDGKETPKTPIGDTKTVTVDGKERTALNSNGKPIHPTVEGVRNFWRWFGDSRVVDKQGRPKVMYHGGTATEEFSRDKIQIGGGFFFTPQKSYAKLYARKVGDDGVVTEAYLKADKLSESIEQTRQTAKRAKEAGRTWLEQAKFDGFDGSVFLSGAEISVFSPTQIKSATGNYGTFDPSNPNIKFSKKTDQAFNGTETSKTPLGDTKTVTVDGKERTVFNSNGKPIHPTVEGVRNFWRWFGDSESVDNPATDSKSFSEKDNQPLVLYHGTASDFDSFKVGADGTNSSALGSWGVKRAAMFFTQDPNIAADFASQGRRSGGSVMPVYVSVSKPIDLRYGFDDDAISSLSEQGIDEGWMYRLRADDIWGIFDDSENGFDTVEAMKAAGYDGAIITEVDPDTGASSDAWVAFSPNQIKSATGNYGSFDPSSPNIKFSGASPENIAKALIAKGYNTKAKAREYMVSKGADRMVDQVMAEFDKLRDAAAARKASAQVTPTPPATPTPPSTTRQDGGGRPMRGSAKRMKEQYPELYAALGEDTIYYDRMPMTVTRDAASELVGWLGLERAKDEVLNRSSDIPDAVRAMMGRMVMKQLADEHRLAELDTFAENFFKLGTSAGQFINALRDVYEEFSKDMIFYRIQRIVEKEVEKKKGKDKNYKKLRDGLTKVNKEVAEEVIRTRKVRDKATDASFPKPDPSKKPKTTPAYGSTNKGVKKSQHDQAWRELNSILPSGVVIPQLVTIAAYHIEAGSRSFAAVAERVIAKGGRKLLPYLKGSYKQAAKDMGIEPSTDAEIDEYINKANTEKIVDKLRKAIKAKDKKSEAAAIAALQQVAKDDGLWGKYRKEAVSRLTRLADQDIKDDIQKDTIIAEFTAGLVRNITDQMKKEAEAKGLESKEPKTPKPAIEIIGDAYRNFDKYEQVWKDTQSEWKRRLNAAEARLAKATTPEAKQKAQADIVNEQSRLDRLDAYYGELMIKPFSEAAIGRAVKDGMKELDQKIDDIIRQHYTVYEAAKQTLADKLVQGAGLTEVEAAKLADAVKAEFERLATERKKALVEQYAKRKFGDKKVTKTEKKGIEDELIFLTNTGAFGEADFINKYGELRGWPKLTDKNIKEIERLADRIQTAPPGRPRLEAIEDLLGYQENLSGVSKWEVAQSVWFANMLSGFETQEVNFLSNQINLAMEVGVAVSKSTVKGKPMDAVNIVRALGYGFARGWYEAGAVMSTGYSPIRGRVDIPPALERYKFPKYLGMYNGLKMVRRVMVAADVLGFEPLKELRAYQYAAMKARSVDPSPIDRQRALDILNRDDDTIAGAKQQAEDEYQADLKAIEERNLTAAEKRKAIAKAERDKNRRAFELVELARDPEVIQESARFAARATYNYTPEGTLGAVAKGVNMILRELPALRYVVPFVNIIANVTNEALNYYAPVGIARAIAGGSVADTIMGRANKGMTEDQKKMHREDLVSKAVIGLVLQAAVLVLSEPGDDDDPLIEITANGYNNYKQNSEMESKGLWKPYSFRIRGTDTWISYQYTPLLFAFGLVGHLRDATKYRKEKMDDSAMTKYAVAMQRNIGTITDASFLATTADALGWLNDTKEGGLDGLARSTAKTVKAMVVPYSALLNQIQQNMDSAFGVPKMDTRGSLTAELIKNTPVAYFVRDKFPIMVDALGDPIIPSSGALRRFATTSDPDPSLLQKLFISAPAPDRFWRLMVDKKYPLSAPNPKTVTVYDDEAEKERILTQDELFKFYQVRGSMIKMELNDRFDELSTLDNKEFAEEMKAIQSYATSEAKWEATEME